ncbi:MAG TPA: hypothetical protein PKZ52_19005, partial [Cellvibrionaceae bacterium]|nr:hypothetical protein [Cellvibrionaceae bacterium]
IDNLVNLSLDGIISNPKSPNQTTPNTSSREAEVVVTAPKPATLGVAVVDTLGDVAHFVKGVPDNQKAAANDFYTLLTGGPIGLVTSKAVEKGMTLLPDPVLQTIAKTSEKVTDTAGQAGTSVLVGVGFDKVKESQESGHEVTEDRVSGVGAVVVTVAGAATAGAAGVLITKAKTPKIKNKNEGNDNPGKEDSEMVGQHQVPVWTTKPEIETLLRNQNVQLKDDWNVDRIYSDVLQVEKGHRPDPSEYLSADYIAHHLAEFDNGAVRFTSRAAVEKYGTAGNNEAFILPKDQFVKMINESNGDLRIVEEKLALSKGYLGDKDTMIVEIKPADLKGLKMPSGNEKGANPLWVPGGRTGGGVSEAVVDLTKTPFTEIILK